MYLGGLFVSGTDSATYGSAVKVPYIPPGSVANLINSVPRGTFLIITTLESYHR